MATPKKTTAKKPIVAVPKKLRIQKDSGIVMVKKLATLNEALFAFQGFDLVIPRNGTGNINGRSYKYATLVSHVVS